MPLNNQMISFTNPSLSNDNMRLAQALQQQQNAQNAMPQNMSGMQRYRQTMSGAPAMTGGLAGLYSNDIMKNLFTGPKSYSPVDFNRPMGA
jgi:hypothetical protein